MNHRYQNACELYGAALSTTPWLTSCFTNRALVHLKLGNYKAAVDDCKEALAVADYNGEKPDSALCLKAHKRKAEGYEGLLKYSKAVRELETALELAPSNQELQQALSETQKRWDQHNKEEEQQPEQQHHIHRVAGVVGEIVVYLDPVFQ